MLYKKARGLRMLVVFALALLLSACENPLDCIIDDRPVINTDNLRQPVLNQVYDSTLGVFIKNNTNDDEFGYRWELDGELPPGITYLTNRRVLAFSGAATSLGEYPFTVSVSVFTEFSGVGDDAEDASDLCRQNVTRSYSLNVAPF